MERKELSVVYQLLVFQHLFRGHSVKTAPAFEWRSVYPETDTNLHSQSVVQKVVAVVLDEEQYTGNDISCSGAENWSQLDPFAPEFFLKKTEFVRLISILRESMKYPFV